MIANRAMSTTCRDASWKQLANDGDDEFSGGWHVGWSVERQMQKPTYLLSVLALGLAACADEPPTPAEVRARIASDLAHVLTEANAASEGAAEAMPADASMALIDRMLGQSDAEVVARMRAKMTAFVVERRVKSAIARLASPEDPVEPDPAAEAVNALNNELFTDANHLGEGVYRVPAELVCTRETYDETTGEYIEAVDPECAADLERAQVRIRVTADDDSMQFALQVTEDKEEPVVATLEAQSLAVTFDLDDAWRSASALAALEGDELPNAELSGQVAGTLAILGTAHAEVSLAIDRDISIKLAEAGQSLDGPEAFRLTSKQADVLSISANGAAKSGAFALGLGETSIHAPTFVDDGTSTTTRALEIDLAGATASATFSRGQPLRVENVSLGNRDLVTKLGGQVASRVGINPDSGRAFSMTLTDDAATGRATIAFTPELDVRTFTDHAVAGTAPAVYDVTRMHVTGSLSGDAVSSTVKVESGTYALETNPAGYGFSAAAGTCVTATEAYDEASGSYYTTFATGACN